MNENVTEQIKKEFIFGTYVKSNKDNSDMIVIKEHIHHPDGTITPNVRFEKNYQRSFYITKPFHRNHEMKKEFEYKYLLDEYRCTHAEMASMAFSKLNGYNPRGYVGMSEINASPYVYGTDTTPTVLIANDYQLKYPNLSSPCSLAVLDYETDVVHGTGDILSGVLITKDKSIITVDKKFLGDKLVGAKETILKMIKEEPVISEYLKNRNIEIDIEFLDRPSDQVKTIMRKAHLWNPDFIGAWNLKFDMNKMIDALKKDNIDPAFIFSHPDLPPEYRYFKFKEDEPFKIKIDETDDVDVEEDDDVETDEEDAIEESNSDGGDKKQRRTPKHHADLWHVATAPMGSFFICLMALFKKVRTGKQQRSSYKLDSVLQETIKQKKLKFAGKGDDLTDKAWHVYMQTHCKLEYIVYMFWDGLSCIIQDEVTHDVSVQLKTIIGKSDMSKMMSNPKQLNDDITFFIPEDTIIGSTSSNMTEPLDQFIPTLRRWIVALSSDLVDNIGCYLNNDLSEMTNVSLFNYDIDVSGAYPSSGIILNNSKSTNKLEVCKIGNLKESQQRSIGINITGIKPNAVSLAQLTYGYISLDEALEEFKKEKGLTV